MSTQLHVLYAHHVAGDVFAPTSSRSAAAHMQSSDEVLGVLFCKGFEARPVGVVLMSIPYFYFAPVGCVTCSHHHQLRRSESTAPTPQGQGNTQAQETSTGRCTGSSCCRHPVLDEPRSQACQGHGLEKRQAIVGVANKQHPHECKLAIWLACLTLKIAEPMAASDLASFVVQI